MCITLCTIVAHNIAQNRPDSFPPYPPDNHHCSDDVYLREGGIQQMQSLVPQSLQKMTFYVCVPFNCIKYLFMATLWNRQAIMLLPCGFYLLSSCCSSPNLSGGRSEMCCARGSLKTQDAKITQKIASAHHRTTLSGCIFATKACIDNRKKTC